MNETYLTSMQASAAAQWLKARGGKDGMTWLDLMGVSEAEASSDRLDALTKAQAATLEDIGRRFAAAAQPQYAEMALQLAASLRAAGTFLANPDQRQQYQRTLAETRQALYERVVAPTIVPGKRLSEPETHSYLSLARDYRLSIVDSKRILNRLAGLEAAEGKYGSFGVVQAPGDPAGTTCFDMLGLDESICDTRLIKAQVDAQTRRAREAEQKFPEQETKRKAREFADEVRQAGETLLSPQSRAAYLQQIRGVRSDKFREEIRLAHPKGQAIKPDLIVRLMAIGKRMRLRDLEIRQVVTEQTGFADYMSLLGERTTPMLGYLEGLRFDIGSGKAQPGAQPDRKTILIRNDGAGVLQGSLTSKCDWIRCQPDGFESSSGTEVEVIINPASLPRGVPVAGQVLVETNGGSQTLSVEAIVGAGDQPADTKERILGAAICLLGTGFFPIGMAAVFFFEKRSRFLTRQGAYSSILGVLFAGSSILGGFGCILAPLKFVAQLLMVVGGGLAVLSLIGKSFRVPILSDLADRFA